MLILPLTLFKVLIWGSIIISAILMCTIFGYFIYELKQKEVW